MQERTIFLLHCLNTCHRSFHSNLWFLTYQCHLPKFQIIRKSAIIIPVFKKGSSSDPSNYRTMSLTCIACKFLESRVKNCLLKHLQYKNLISKQQHGFQSNRSTTTQLLECCNDWCVHVSAKRKVDAIYLDFSKAFDLSCTLNYSIKLINLAS